MAPNSKAQSFEIVVLSTFIMMCVLVLYIFTIIAVVNYGECTAEDVQRVFLYPEGICPTEKVIAAYGFGKTDSNIMDEFVLWCVESSVKHQEQLNSGDLEELKMYCKCRTYLESQIKKNLIPGSRLLSITEKPYIREKLELYYQDMCLERKANDSFYGSISLGTTVFLVIIWLCIIVRAVRKHFHTKDGISAEKKNE
jgi:hypothetical protein